MMLYKADRLTKVVGDRVILDVSSLTIEAGKIYGLLGANGAGKTTLLNILGFLEPPTFGSIEFAGRPARFTRSGMQQLRRELVMVDQHPVLFSTSVHRNIEFGLKIRKVERSQRERIIDEVLEMVGLSSFKNEPAQGLSGGETQRIALARGLALSPKVLLCDEPTSSVDIENQAAIIAILKEINTTRSISIIFTSHDRFQAAGLAHQTLVLENGSLINGGYENIFSCTLKNRTAGNIAAKAAPTESGGVAGAVASATKSNEEQQQVECNLPNGVKLLLPMQEKQVQPGTRRISIDPKKITLLQATPEQNTPGILHGKVVQLMAENNHIRMVVNVGVMLTVSLERSRYYELSPAIGDKVWLQVLAGAV